MHAVTIFLDDKLGILHRQEHMMIQLINDRPCSILECNKIEDVMILIKIAFDFDGDPIIMSVELLALVAIIGDEVRTAKHEIVFSDVNFVTIPFHAEYRNPESSRIPTVPGVILS